MKREDFVFDHMYNVGSMMPWMDYTPRTLDEILRLEAVYKNEAAEPPAAQ